MENEHVKNRDSGKCKECIYYNKCAHTKEECEQIWETWRKKLGVEVLQELCPRCGYYVCRCNKEEELLVHPFIEGEYYTPETCLHCGAKKLSDGFCPKCNRAWQFDKCKCGGYKPIDEELCSACKEKDMGEDKENKEEKYAVLNWNRQSFYSVKGMNQAQLLALSVYVESVLNRKKIEEQLQQALNWEKSKKQDLDETMKK